MTRWREVHEQPKRSGVDLAKVLDHYGVRYLPHRTEQMVSCPMHEDRTPSLSVNLTENRFLCHSCGLAGNTGLTLIIHKEGLDVDGARAFAAALGAAEVGDGGGGESVRGSAYGGRARRAGSSRRSLAEGAGTGQEGGRYVPPWRRQ